MDLVRRTVIRRDQFPILEGLPLEQSQLLGQKALAIESAKENRDGSAGRRRELRRGGWFDVAAHLQR